MSRSQRYSWALAGVVGFLLGVGLDALSAQADAPSPLRHLDRFAEVLALVDRHYVEPVDVDALLAGASRGVVETLDPHSQYLDPEEYALFQSATEGRFVGIGVQIELRDGWLLVTTVFPGGPAALGGVQPGDRVLAIDGVLARDLRIEEAVRRVRGESGSFVELALRREGVEDAVRVRLARAPVTVRAVESRLLPDDTLYVRLRVFQESTAEELRRALDDAVLATRPRAGVAGVLLDLRQNPGGLLSQAAEVADEFLADGVIVSMRGRDGRSHGELRASRRGTRPDWPVVVLVDGFSASASEIVAGALRDHRRAVVVGTRTFGKGSVQTVLPLRGGAGLKLTTARYFTPSGRSIQAQGIEPDVIVPATEPPAPPAEPRPQPTEASLDRHLGPGRPELPRASSFELFPDDYQAAMAHQTLRASAVVR